MISPSQTTLWPSKKSIAFIDATDVENECFSRCPRDCVDVTYDFTIKRKKWGFDIPQEIPVQVKHDYKHDIVIKHFPEFPLMTYIASIGGLAGLWLGFSIITLYDNLMKYVIYLRRQYRSVKQQRNISKEGRKYSIAPNSTIKRNADNRRRNTFLSELATDNHRKAKQLLNHNFTYTNWKRNKPKIVSTKDHCQFEKVEHYLKI